MSLIFAQALGRHSPPSLFLLLRLFIDLYVLEERVIYCVGGTDTVARDPSEHHTDQFGGLPDAFLPVLLFVE